MTSWFCAAAKQRAPIGNGQSAWLEACWEPATPWGWTGVC